MPNCFMGKTWIFVAQAVLFGCLALFSLVSGSLFLSGIAHKANGAPATDAGIALSIMSVPFLLLFALAVYNLRARRRPVLRLCREGIEITQIGSSSLDRIPLIPTLVRVAWLILSTQGFRRKIIRTPWGCFREARVSGPPMSRRLSITASPFPVGEGVRVGPVEVVQGVYYEVEFTTPLDRIAEAIKSRADSPDGLSQLPSWAVDSVKEG
ncbi:MAG: hypothetical protein ACRC33_06490 [Gemmataceae bacterium]